MYTDLKYKDIALHCKSCLLLLKNKYYHYLGKYFLIILYIIACVMRSYMIKQQTTGLAGGLLIFA